MRLQDRIQEYLEWQTWLSETYMNRNYQSTVVGVDAANLTARAMLERFVSDADNNFVNFSDATYDETFAKAIAETDDQKQTDLYLECEKILTEKAANVYIQDLANLVAIRDGYDGYVFYPLYVQDMSTIYKTK